MHAYHSFACLYRIIGYCTCCVLLSVVVLRHVDHILYYQWHHPPPRRVGMHGEGMHFPLVMALSPYFVQVHSCAKVYSLHQQCTPLPPFLLFPSFPPTSSLLPSHPNPHHTHTHVSNTGSTTTFVKFKLVSYKTWHYLLQKREIVCYSDSNIVLQ